MTPESGDVLKTPWPRTPRRRHARPPDDANCRVSFQFVVVGIFYLLFSVISGRGTVTKFGPMFVFVVGTDASRSCD